MAVSPIVAEIDKAIQQQGLFVLDGGLGSELEKRGYDVSSALWSADLIINNPDALKEVHMAYLEAGARCITTASYQASIEGLQKLGYDWSESRRIILQSVALARESVETFLQSHPQCGYRPLVVASIGPYGAALADGSEYRGNYGLSADELADFHRQRLQWMDQSGADCLAIETIPDLLEAQVLSELSKDVQTPCWVSFCCADGSHLHDGNRLRDAAVLFNDKPSVFALGINCTTPAFIDDLVAELKAVAGDKRIVVYPNSGADYDARLKCWSGHETAEEFSRLADGWKTGGAEMIGGCCGIGPEQIKALNEKLSPWR